MLSLITITYNNPDLKKTLDSVKSQTINSKNIEHIIVDNLSTDDTQNIVARYRDSVKYKVTYIREKDTGRYQAMNKGITHAAGEYLLFLNAGDKLHQKDVLQKILPHLNTDIIYGNIKGKSLDKFPVNWQFFLDRTFFHQATFINKKLFDNYGLYDEDLIISSDLDFFIKAIFCHQASNKYLPFTVTDYDDHGISSQKSDLVYSERALVLSRYAPIIYKPYHYLKYLYYRYKTFFPKYIVNYQKKRLASKLKI